MNVQRACLSLMIAIPTLLAGVLVPKATPKPPKPMPKAAKVRPARPAVVEVAAAAKEKPNASEAALEEYAKAATQIPVDAAGHVQGEQQPWIQPNVDYHARLADLFLERVIPKHDWPRVRFLSFIGIPEKSKNDRLRTLWFWTNSLHFEPDVERIQEVPRSDGMLYWFYLDDFGWSEGAWRAVSHREPYFVEPFVFFDVARSLQHKLGIEQDKKEFHLEAIIRADWLFRDSVESDRSPTYYDLLFSRQRFGESSQTVPSRKLVDKTIDHPGGDYLWYDGSVTKNAAPGKYQVKVYENLPAAKVNRQANFPKDENDWNKVFGIDVLDKFLKDVGINARNGAIVDEGHSIVARNNRLLERLRTVFGSAKKTFDVNATAGDRDFGEKLIFDFQFDAGEYIANLPNGGQAYLLTDGKGKRLEVADNKVATDSDSRDRRVRTPGSCVICHPKGVNIPQNLTRDLLLAGIELKFKDKRKARDTRAFLLGWESELEDDQRRYAVFVKKTSGWGSDTNARKFQEFRDAYDAAVTPEQAAREMGIPVAVMKEVLFRSPRLRHNQLVDGQSIPRSAWEFSEYRQAMLILEVARKAK